MLSLTPNNGAFFHLQLMIPVVSLYFFLISVSTIRLIFVELPAHGPLGDLWMKGAEVCLSGEQAKGR